MTEGSAEQGRKTGLQDGGAQGPERSVIHLSPGGGRRYAMGRLTALFKADEDETGAGYSISE